MLKSEDKRAMRAACKEVKTMAGIYAIRCSSADSAWVGPASDLAKIRNRIWFELTNGTHPSRILQSAWHDHGAEAFEFVALEQWESEEAPYIRRAHLKERLLYWQSILGADRL